MSAHPDRHNQPINEELHPLVYKTMVGLIVWLVLSVWALFDRGAYIGLILAMVTVIFLAIMGIPTLIWLTWQRRAADTQHEPDESFRTWALQEFRAWTGTLTGGAAAAQILLPIAAVAIGMTVFGLVLDITIPHLS